MNRNSNKIKSTVNNFLFYKYTEKSFKILKILQLNKNLLKINEKRKEDKIYCK